MADGGYRYDKDGNAYDEKGSRSVDSWYDEYYEHGDSRRFYEKGGNDFHQLEPNDPIAAFYSTAKQLYKFRLFLAQGQKYNAGECRTLYARMFNKLVAGEVDGVKYRREALQEHMEELVEQKIREEEASLPGLNEHAGMYRPMKDR